MNYIVLDLEWNQSYRGKEYSIEEMPFEIIQIGAVKLDEHKNITGRWERIIRPVEYVKLHGKVSEMLEITEDELKMGDDFASAAKEFLEWYFFIRMDLTDSARAQAILSFTSILPSGEEYPLITTLDSGCLFI